MWILSALLIGLVSFLAGTGSASPDVASTAADEPAPPGLTFLYTAYVECAGMYAVPGGPKGDRNIIPIIGGNFTGPRVKGKILNLGADWGYVDSKGTFTASTRYHFQTDDGANIIIETSGPSQANGDLYLRASFEVGDPKYYWMNNLVSIAKLHNVGNTTNGFWLRIDTWHPLNQR